ncbi:type II secretion system protein GspL [Myxococcota bacterium]|nr:type II secretion system protein GspL [Myxococcota bacterium]
MASTVIGLDVGSSAVKAVVLSGGSRGYQVQRAASRAIEPVEVEPVEGEAAPQALERARAEAERRAIRGLLEEVSGRDTSIVAAVAGNRASTSQVDLPFSQVRQIEQTLPGVLEDRVPFELDEMLLEWHVVESGIPLPEGGEGSKVFAVLVPRRHVARRLEELAAAGADPRHLTLDACALALLAPEALAGEGPAALVDVGERRTTILIVKGGETRLVRTLDHGGEDLTEAVARAVGCSRGEAEHWKRARPAPGEATLEGLEGAVAGALGPLLSELHATLAGFENRGDGEISRIWVTGGGSLLPGLREQVGDVLGIPVEPLPLPRGDVDPHLAPDVGPEHALAFGLALRGVQPGRGWTPHFRRGELAYRRDVQTTRLAVLAAVALVLLGVVAGTAWFAVRHGQLTRELAGLEGSIVEQVKAEVPDASPSAYRTAGGATALMMEKALEMQRKADQVTREGGLTALDVLKRLSEVVPVDVKVDLDELSVSDEVINLRGRTDSFDAVDRVESALKKDAEFVAAYKHDRTGSAGVTRFAITIPRGAGEDAAVPGPAGGGPATPGTPPAPAPAAAKGGSDG